MIDEGQYSLFKSKYMRELKRASRDYADSKSDELDFFDWFDSKIRSQLNLAQVFASFMYALEQNEITGKGIFKWSVPIGFRFDVVHK